MVPIQDRVSKNKAYDLHERSLVRRSEARALVQLVATAHVSLSAVARISPCAGCVVTRMRQALAPEVAEAYAGIARGVYPLIPDFGIVESAEVVGGCLRVVKPFTLADVALDIWWDDRP